VNENQQSDLLRAAEHARDEYGMERLYDHVLDALAELTRKGDLIDTLLEENERLRLVSLVVAA
jgi:hypothetical protein